VADDESRADAQEYLVELLGELKALVRANRALVKQNERVVAQNQALITQVAAVNANLVALQQRMDLAYGASERLEAALIEAGQARPAPTLVERIRDRLAPPVQHTSVHVPPLRCWPGGSPPQPFPQSLR
jgi:hypothetical protein